jgi:hypothetical protein
MTNARAADSTRGYASTTVQKASLIVGIVFLLVGLAGFIPGLTTAMETMQFAGSASGALLLGIFQVSILHNIVHLLFGVAGVAFARTASGARNYLVWGGAIYLVLWLYGVIFAGDNPGNFVPINSADNWLHLVLGLGMIALGVLLGRNRERAHAHA